MAARDLAPAALILDGLLMSDGVADLEPGYVQELVRLVRAAGGLFIADEVQAGHGRTGEALWAFERFGVVPDFVTLGKPMGNGHPVAAVVTRRDVVARIAGETTLFSTFGGNPVSAAAALAVPDVLDDEQRQCAQGSPAARAPARAREAARRRARSGAGAGVVLNHAHRGRRRL